jgi:hypothetical protein
MNSLETRFTYYSIWAKLEAAPCILCRIFNYNYLEETSKDLIGLANALNRD